MNKDLLKNRNFQIGAVIVVVLILAGGFLILRNSSSSPTQVNSNILPSEAPVAKISAGDIGLTLVADARMQKATMTVTKTENIKSLEYQLTYFALVSGEQVQRGTVGNAEVKNPGETVTQDMIFGTCSDVCHYDNDITDVKLIVKVTKTNGNIYQAETSLASE